LLVPTRAAFAQRCFFGTEPSGLASGHSCNPPPVLEIPGHGKRTMRG